MYSVKLSLFTYFPNHAIYTRTRHTHVQKPEPRENRRHHTEQPPFYTYHAPFLSHISLITQIDIYIDIIWIKLRNSYTRF